MPDLAQPSSRRLSARVPSCHDIELAMRPCFIATRRTRSSRLRTGPIPHTPFLTQAPRGLRMERRCSYAVSKTAGVTRTFAQPAPKMAWTVGSIDPEPTLLANPDRYPEELWGIEDPRITYVEELRKYAIAYTAFGRSGPGVALALTEDFRTFERYGIVMQPDDKDAALLPRRVNGNFALDPPPDV